MNIAVVLAGGKGSRMKIEGSKQFLDLMGKPVFFHSIEIFDYMKEFDHIVLVYNPAYKEKYKEYMKNIKTSYSMVEAGNERWESSLNALEYINSNFKDVNMVSIHDGARPFITENIVKDILDQAIKFEGAIPGVPVKDTIKKIDQNGFIESTPKRSDLFAVFTPQIFRFSRLFELFKKTDLEKSMVTDDASIFEIHGIKVKIVKSDERNIKITTQSDLSIAEKIYKEMAAEREI